MHCTEHCGNSTREWLHTLYRALREQQWEWLYTHCTEHFGNSSENGCMHCTEHSGNSSERMATCTAQNTAGTAARKWLHALHRALQEQQWENGYTHCTEHCGNSSEKIAFSYGHISALGSHLSMLPHFWTLRFYVIHIESLSPSLSTSGLTSPNTPRKALQTWLFLDLRHCLMDGFRLFIGR